MRQVTNWIKTSLLLGALAIVGWSAFPSVAEAGEAVYCESTDHTCHVEINGVVYHLKLV